ncbi:MAG: 6-carboxytetrahydropterin synthase [Deltaproteobacteria bacterium]|nr:6-carboxytetrahydropterin synthase [Deltaproteobacteria bacterium]
MSRLFVGKDEHRFAAAHMTVFPDGTKEPLHGHNFQSSITVDVDDDAFMDLSEIRAALRAETSPLHRRLLVATRAQGFELVLDGKDELEFKLAGRRYVIPRDEAVLLPIDNITCERLAGFLAHRVAERLRSLTSSGLRSMEVRVEESMDQGASHLMMLG